MSSTCKRPIRTLLLLAIVLAAAPGSGGAAEEESDSEPAAGYAEVIERLKEAARHEVAAKDLPAFSIALVEGDKRIWAAGFGFQDQQRKRPATAETVYRVGSVSKLFTDLAVMQLVEQGKLSLDDPVARHLPSFKAQGEGAAAITLRQLMSHQSGLVREPPVGHYFDPDEPSLQETVASLNATSLTYPPQTKTKYSNAAIAVVGAVLEERLGMPYWRRIEEAILEPLAMRESGFVRTPAIDEKLADALMWTYDGRRFEAPKFALGTAPAGNMYSSVADLSKFLLCLFREGQAEDRAILQPETLAEMLAPVAGPDGKPLGFGLGFHVQELDGHRKVGHGGAVYGFSTQLEALPERKLGVAAVAALDGSNGVVGRLTDYALRLMLARQEGKPLPSYRTTGPVPAERARELVGDYRHEDEFATIAELGGRVYLQRGTYRHELRAASDNGEILVDDAIAFGSPVRLNGEGELVIGEMAFRREPDEPPAEAPQRWKGLLGEYGWDHNTLYILEDRGRLVALIEWFYAYPLTELSENEFAFPDKGLYHGEKLKFTRDASGEATAVVAAEVLFKRREVGTRDGETFKITPIKPIDALRESAMTATPPTETGDFRETDLVEVASLDPTIRLDIRYATTNNFTGAVFYQQPRAFLQRPAAEAVVRAHRRLKSRGLGLLIHDAYRPWHVTKMFWDATPDDLKDFVANPANGSRHNRGCAVDLTLCDLATGEPITMVAGYDEFSPRSFPQYPGGASRQRWHRELLRRTMEAEGFTVYENEWWHFDYRDWRKYRIGNGAFEEIAAADEQAAAPLTFEIERSVARRGYDGKTCWVHARAGAIPPASEGAAPEIVLTTQRLQVTGSDVFEALHSMSSRDLGKTWTPLAKQAPFERRRIDDRTEVTVCDFTPKWHAASGALLGVGQTVWYRDNAVMKVRPRATAYAVYDPKSQAWSAWKELALPDEPRFKNCGAGSVQRLDLASGEILLPVYLKEPEAEQYAVTVLRCRFDGRELTFVEQGNELTVKVKRGLYEPSITQFGDRFYLTMRNDDQGYVATSRDGLHFDEPRRWTFDDGADLGNYNTQQHWVAHREGLFLVYTRKGADNDHVFRHRAPLFIAQVDPESLTVIRSTEQIVVPQCGARLGNFGVTEVSPQETWITAAEWMQTWGPNPILPVDNPFGADNSLHIARLKWRRPNQDAATASLDTSAPQGSAKRQPPDVGRRFDEPLPGESP